MQQTNYAPQQYSVPDFKCVNPVVHASPKLRIALQIEHELTPAFLYIRTSTKEQKIYGGSQEEQEIRMNWYAQKNNLNLK